MTTSACSDAIFSPTKLNPDPIVQSSALMIRLALAACWLGADDCLRADPAVAALTHLERVAEKRLNLEPGGDTAISPHVGPLKKRQIPSTN